MKRLTPEEVREILRRVVDGRRAGKRGGHPDSQTSLAREFGVAQSNISRIVAREYYRRVKP